MSNTGADLHPIHELLASDLASVDIAEESVMKRAEHVGFDEDARMDLGLAVREAMVNAVVHGNNYHPKKKVALSIHTSMDSLRVVILDQGAGFEVKAVPDPLGQLTRPTLSSSETAATSAQATRPTRIPQLPYPSDEPCRAAPDRGHGISR